MPITLFKIGGSLLELPDLGQRVESLIARRPEAAPLLVVGGGHVADVVRRWDALHGLGEERAHWLAIRSLTVSAALLVELIPRCVLVSSPIDAAACADTGRLPILDVERFLRRDDAQPDALPHAWDVTSDSIAARAAISCGAGELVLAKSVPLPGSLDVATARLHGLVDAYFPRLAGAIPRVSWADLRHQPDIQPWLELGQPVRSEGRV